MVLLAEVVVDDSLDSRSILFGVGLLLGIVVVVVVESFSSLISTMGKLFSSLVGEDTIKSSSKDWMIGDIISSVVSYSSD